MTPPSGMTLTNHRNGTATLAGTSAVVARTHKFILQAANLIPPTPTQAFTLSVNRVSRRRYPSSSLAPSTV